MALLLVLVIPNVSRGQTIDDCDTGDAPSGWDTENCQSVCQLSGNELICELETICTNIGSQAHAVSYNGNHDVVIFGGCLDGGLTKFCCTFYEGAGSVNTIGISGTDYDDEVLGLHYSDGTNEYNLQPWYSDPIDGVVRANAGADRIWGSKYAGSDYEEQLYGQNGADTILAHAGDDFLSGGTGDDYLSGGDGIDVTWGGDGDDQHIGGDGADKLCDRTGFNACATSGQGGNYFEGGAGNDKIWYDESENPGVPCPDVLMDPDSSAGGGTGDECGDANDFLSTELPQLCEDTTITVAPTRCEGQGN